MRSADPPDKFITRTMRDLIARWSQWTGPFPPDRGPFTDQELTDRLTRRGEGLFYLPNFPYPVLVHELSYCMHMGPLPPQHRITQSCGHLDCFEPTHLKLEPEDTSTLGYFCGDYRCQQPLHHATVTPER